MAIHPRFAYGLTYGTGLLSGSGRGEDTVIQTVSPGVRLELGREWQLDYSPRLSLYSANGFRDPFNQAVSLEGTGRRGEWDLNFANAYSDTDTPLIETGRQTQRTMNNTRFGAGRSLERDLSVNLDVDQSLRWTGGFNRVFSWSTTDSLYYQWRPTLAVGLVGGLGYDQVEPGFDMTSERLQGQVQGKVGEKLAYSATGGAEFRQFQGAGAGTKVSPIVDGNVSYQITEVTGISAYYSRRVSPSLFNDQFNEVASAGGSVNQRFFGKLHMTLTGGFRWTDRNATSNPGLTQQSDDYVFAKVELVVRWMGRGTASVFFLWGNYDSTQSTLSYNTRQVGVQVGFGL